MSLIKESGNMGRMKKNTAFQKTVKLFGLVATLLIILSACNLINPNPNPNPNPNTGGNPNSGGVPTPVGSAELMYSTSADRSSPVALDGATVSGDIYVFLDDAGVEEAVFYLDNSASPAQTEGVAPLDFAGTDNATGKANPFDTTTLSDGSHTISVDVTKDDATTDSGSATFTVSN